MGEIGIAIDQFSIAFTLADDKISGKSSLSGKLVFSVNRLFPGYQIDI